MTLATGVRHNIIIMAFGWVRVLEDRALTGPNDIEDVGGFVALGYGALSVLVEGKVIFGIDADILQLTGLRHMARCGCTPHITY